MSIIRLNINGKEVIGQEGQTILAIARANGINIPTLCHDDRVKAYGSCGVCVVEAAGMPRLLRSCSTIAADGMIIETHSKRALETRRSALELLLSDHQGDCRPPCVLACPGQTDCQGYVGLIANGQYREALALIKDRLPLPASIGRVCPHPCETACRRKLVEEPIDIAHLKQFVADQDLASDMPYQTETALDTGKNVAIIGGGPGGLSAAYFLRANGHGVTIYDAMSQMGGMLRYGIPEYRLPKDIVDQEVALIENMGVKLVNGVKIGHDLTLDYLRHTFDAVIIAIGAWTSMGIRCPGEELTGVLGGIDFLRDVAENKPLLTGRRIAVVGGGNTAMDACRTAIRLGAEQVYNIYRRTKSEMPAEEIEIIEAEEEGVIFKNLTNPLEIIDDGNGKVSKLRLQIMALGEPDASGRRAPVPVPGQEEVLDVDTVILAIGQGTDPVGFESITLTKRGTIAADESTFRTNLEGVFAIGDATNRGADIAIAAIGEAKRASGVIDGYLHGRAAAYKEPFLVKRDDITAETLADRPKAARVHMPHRKPQDRRNNFQEVNFGLAEEAARKEASRCLECGCHDYFECKLIKEANVCGVKPGKYAGETHQRTVADDHPFIRRNPDKCILCGLCVRVCDETMGVTALGLLDRGFDTMVKPALGLPLAQTGCIACGQCVALCPTGALLEVTGAVKQVPLAEQATHSTCGYCSLGCQVSLTTNGEMLLRSLPDSERDSNTLLCAKGRFGLTWQQKDTTTPRITSPMIRKAEGLVPVSWREAYTTIAKKTQGLAAQYGQGALMVSVSDQLTNEHIQAVQDYTENTLQTCRIGSFNLADSGLPEVLGHRPALHSFAEVLNTDVVLLLDDDLLKSHTIAAVRLKQRAEEGALKLITLSREPGYLSPFAATALPTDGTLAPLRQWLKALLDMGYDVKAEGLDALKTYVSEESVSTEISAAAQTYAKAKNAMILYDQGIISTDAEKLLAAIALVSGHGDKPRNGIVPLLANVNSQGLALSGISPASSIPVDVKGLLVFGEDMPHLDTSGLEFLMVQDTHLTETAQKADVVLPAAMLYEAGGTVINSFGEQKRVAQALAPLCGKSNTQILSELAGQTPRKLPEFAQAITNAPVAQPMLCLPEDDRLYRQGTPNTYAAYRRFSAYLEQQGIVCNSFDII